MAPTASSCPAAIAAISSGCRQHFGMPFVRGPDEIADLPAFLGRAGEPPDLSRHDMRIFAEIVDAPMLSIDALVARARTLAAAGADVIDLGCLPETPFPLLGEAVRELKAEGFSVSVDSANLDELRDRRAGRCGLSSQPRREHAAARLRAQGDAGADPVGSRRSGFARPRHRGGATGRHPLHRRSRARPDPFRLCRIARPLHRGAPPLAGGRIDDGHRQSHRTDRRRQFRRHRASGRALLGASDPQCARRQCQPAYGADGRGARSRPPHPVCRQAATARCRAAIIPACCRSTTASPSGIDRGYRRSCRRGARRQFPHHDRRGRHPYLQRQGPCGRAGRFRTLCRARRRERTARTPSISARS